MIFIIKSHIRGCSEKMENLLKCKIIFIYLEFLLCYCYTLNAINYFVFVLFIFINEPLGLHIEYIGKYGFILNIILFIFGFDFFIVLGKNENFKLNKIFVFISLYVDLIV